MKRKPRLTFLNQVSKSSPASSVLLLCRLASRQGSWLSARTTVCLACSTLIHLRAFTASRSPTARSTPSVLTQLENGSLSQASNRDSCLFGSGNHTTSTGVNITSDYLDAFPATLILIAYAAVFSFSAIATTLRKDID